jgi:RNA polymerase sigma-70 factor (ECF subfamily)
METTINNLEIDKALVLVRAGQAEQFEVVIRQFEQPLRSWLAAQSMPEIDVDEVAQKSFIAAYVRLHEYELGTNFSAWLFAIARFQLKTETSRLRRIADYKSRYTPELLVRELDRQSSEQPEAVATRLEYLKQCVESLEENLSQYLSWRYRDEISLEEMAQRSGRSVAAVKKQLWVLRQKLKECIELRAASVNHSCAGSMFHDE